MRRAMILVLLLDCSSSTPDCSAIALDAQRQAKDRVDFHRSGCATDSDCTTIEVALTCFKGCPAGVLAARKSEAQADLDAISSSACGSSDCMVNIGCNPAYLKCVAMQCIMIEGTPDAGADGGKRDAGSTDGG